MPLLIFPGYLLFLLRFSLGIYRLDRYVFRGSSIAAHAHMEQHSFSTQIRRLEAFKFNRRAMSRTPRLSFGQHVVGGVRLVMGATGIMVAGTIMDFDGWKAGWSGFGRLCSITGRDKKIACGRCPGCFLLSFCWGNASLGNLRNTLYDRQVGKHFFYGKRTSL